MKPIMAVSTRGKCSRANALSRSGTRVVAARITEAAAPRVALATMFQAAQQPVLRERHPDHLDALARGPTKGRNTANSRKGASISEPAEQEARGQPPGGGRRRHQGGVNPEGPEGLPRGGHHRHHEQQGGRQLHLGAQAVQRPLGVPVEGVDVALAQAGFLAPAGLAVEADAVEQAAGDEPG